MTQTVPECEPPPGLQDGSSVSVKCRHAILTLPLLWQHDGERQAPLPSCPSAACATRPNFPKRLFRCFIFVALAAGMTEDACTE